MSALDELLDRVKGLPPEKIEELHEEAKAITKGKLWVPNPGPQTEAYFSQADILLYGGQAGGGKTHLELGIGINEGYRSIIFRRELTQTDGLEAEGLQIIGTHARYNGQDHEWTWPDGRSLKLGSMKGPEDWRAHAGRERDKMMFDEATEFLEHQVASILAWLRGPDGIRTRVILASNPPRTSDGLWVIQWFAPWLDPQFPDRAAPGELRWGCYVKDKVVWVEGPGAHVFAGESYIAKSYTFIPASLEDNPYRNTKEYRATLMSLPEPLRSQLLYGDWQAGMKDSANQTIPTSWVQAAMKRWTPDAPFGIPQCSIGVDCAGGGDDNMILAPRYDNWFDELVKIPGSEIPQEKAGSHAAGLVVSHRRDDSVVVVDMGGGYGGPLYEHLMENEIETIAYKGAEATTRRSKDKKLGFVNTRSAAYWAFREALDPDQPGGSNICLPNDQRLLAGLTAPTFEVTPRGIKVEAKSKREGGVKGVVERLGFSPDEADAVVMAWWGGPREATSALEWADRKEKMRGRNPQVIMGRPNVRRSR